MTTTTTTTPPAPAPRRDMPRVLTDAEVYAMAQEAKTYWQRPGWFVPDRAAAKQGADDARR